MTWRKCEKTIDNTEKEYQQFVGMVTAYYEIALIVAKNKLSHTIEKELITPAVKMLIKHVIGDETALKLNGVSLSNNMMQRRIAEMCTDINKQVLKEIESSKYGFAIQLGKTTDVSIAHSF